MGSIEDSYLATPLTQEKVSSFTHTRTIVVKVYLEDPIRVLVLEHFIHDFMFGVRTNMG